MNYKRAKGALFVIILICGAAAGLNAQITETVPPRGFMPNHDQLSGPIDNIDIATGRLNLTIPLGSLPDGPGGSGYSLNLHYDSNIFELWPDARWSGNDPYTGVPYPPQEYANISVIQRGGWKYSGSAQQWYAGQNTDLYKVVSDSIEVPLPPVNDHWYYYNDLDCQSGKAVFYRRRVVFPDGSSHILYPRQAGGGYPWPVSELGYYGFWDVCARMYLGWPDPPQNPTWFTEDGTYLYEDSTGFYFADGRRVIGNREYDANGNYIERSIKEPADCVYSAALGCEEISNAAGQKLTIYYSVEAAGVWGRDLVVVPGPDGDLLYSIDWQIITVNGDENIPLINYSLPSPYIYHGYTNLELYFRAVRYIQLPYKEHLPLSYIASGDKPDESNSYEFEYNGGEYKVCTYGQYPDTDCIYKTTELGLLSYIRTPTGSEYHYEYGSLYPFGHKPNWRVLNGDPHVPEWYGCETMSPYCDAEALVKTMYVKTKTVISDTEALLWAFDRGDPVVPEYTVKITNPDGGVTKYHYESPTLSMHYNGGGLPKMVEYYDAGGNKAREQKRFWINDGLHYYYGAPPGNSWLSKEIDSVINAAGDGCMSAITTYDRDGNGNLLEKIEYDWVNSAVVNNECSATDGNTVRRKTEYDYYIPSGTKYLEPNTSIWPTSGMPRRLNAVKRVTVYEGSSTPKAATEYVYDNPYTTGNVTIERRWDSVKEPLLPALGGLTSLNSQETMYSYDQYGNVTDIYEPPIDGAGTKPHTKITYDATGSRIEQVETGYGTAEQRTAQYDWYNNGAAFWKKLDLENNVATEYDYDAGGRVISVVESTGNTGLRGTWTEYDDENRTVTVAGDLKAYGDGLIQTRTYYDQLGRVVLVQQSEDGNEPTNENDGIKVRTSEIYPVLNTISGQYIGERMTLTTTPYRNDGQDYPALPPDPTLEWSCTQYDTLGRITMVSTFNGSIPYQLPLNCASNGNPNFTGATQMSYDAEWTTITDPAGNVRKQRVDALGRLVEVVEDPNVLNYGTTYEYDALDNLTQVTQGSQTRTFTYSSLSRLLAATNPESGMTEYTYYDSGDLKRKTYTRNTTDDTWSEMTYDVLHRVKTKAYSDTTTPGVTYEYHLTGNSYAPNIGRLKSVTAKNASNVVLSANTYNEYDELGRVINSSHFVEGTGTKTFAYEWYLNGALKQQTYPSGKVVNYDVDDAGRTDRVYTTATNYINTQQASTGITDAYAPDGRIAKMRLGNGLYETREYNRPGTSTAYKLGTTLGSGNKTQIDYEFLTLLSGPSYNGNVLTQSITRPGLAWAQNYTYDALNRLATATESGGWSRTYAYDRYGNRWISASSGLAYNDPLEPTQQSHFNATNNRLTMAGVSYDAAGNQTAYDGLTLEYDAEGRSTKVKINNADYAIYTYDGEGRRVKKTLIGIPTTTTYYIYNALGQLAAEYSDGSADSGTSYLFTDMLGSVRTITDASGAVTECYDYLPFGRILSLSVPHS